MIYLITLLATRISPIRQPTFLNARKDLIELGLAHEKGVVLRPDIGAGIHKIQRQIITDSNDCEGAKEEGRSQAENTA